MKASLLHVVGAYFNHWRAPHRSQLARKWVKDALDSGANVTFVEHALGERPYEFSAEDPDFKHVNLVQIRGDERYEVGLLKEGLLNYGFSRLPEDARYVCWQDMDVAHVRPDWAAETVHMLQHYFVGQTWTHSVDLDEAGNVMRNEWGNDADRSFSAAFAAGDVTHDSGAYLPPRALIDAARKPDARSHSGYSWAIRRSALTGIGRLVDWDIIGSADYQMARCFAGAFAGKFDFAASPAYVRRYAEFARLCDLHIRQSVGVVPGDGPRRLPRREEHAAIYVARRGAGRERLRPRPRPGARRLRPAAALRRQPPAARRRAPLQPAARGPLTP